MPANVWFVQYLVETLSPLGCWRAHNVRPPRSVHAFISAANQKPPRKGYAFRGGSPSSIIFRVDFKVALGVIAGGADFGGLGAHHDVAAVAALPHFYFALGKHFCHFNVVQQGAVALFVMLFNSSHQAEPGSQFGEASSSAVLAKLSYISVHS